MNEREDANTHSQSSGFTRYSSQSEATCRGIYSTKDESIAEEGSSNDEALTSPKITHSGESHGGDAHLQDSTFKPSSSSDVPLGGKASKKMSEDATVNGSTGVVQVMELSPVLLSVKDHLTEVERSWVELHDDFTAVQHKLHQVTRFHSDHNNTLSKNLILFINPISQHTVTCCHIHPESDPFCFPQCALRRTNLE